MNALDTLIDEKLARAEKRSPEVLRRFMSNRADATFFYGIELGVPVDDWAGKVKFTEEFLEDVKVLGQALTETELISEYVIWLQQEASGEVEGAGYGDLSCWGDHELPYFLQIVSTTKEGPLKVPERDPSWDVKLRAYADKYGLPWPEDKVPCFQVQSWYS